MKKYIPSHQFHVKRGVFTGRIAIIFVNKANVLGNSQIVITIGFVCNQPEIQEKKSSLILNAWHQIEPFFD